MWLVSYRTWSGTREGDALSEEVTGPQGDEEAEDAATVVGDTVGVPWGIRYSVEYIFVSATIGRGLKEELA